MENKKQILSRMYLLYLLTALLGIFIVFRLIQIQFVEGEQWIKKAKERTIKEREIKATRGDIYSSDGSLLATSIPRYEIRMDPCTEALTDEIFKKEIDSLSLCLSKIFKDNTPLEYKNKITKARKNKDRYLLLSKKKVGYLELKKIKKFPIFRRGRNKGGLIEIVDASARKMPYGILAGRTIGYYNENSQAKVGIEGAYNTELSGVGGLRLMQKIAGNIWMPLNDDNEIDPKDGSDVITTIDINIQDVAEHALLKQLTKNKADHGCVILMEVETGEIKAIANLKKNENDSYGENFNYAIGESTEPGSTFKLASLICALEDGYIDLNDSVTTDGGEVRFHGSTMRDSKKGGYGKISVQSAFELSSNVGISKIINKNYSKQPEKFIDHLYEMGLGTPLNLEIKGEGKPYIKTADSKSWSGTSIPWMSIGYELQLTPIHILTFYNAVANNGKMVKPKFVRELQKDGKTIKSFKTEIINNQICSKSTIAKAKKMLEGVVERGTAKNLKGFHVKIAGKTGTAQIANAKYGYKYNSVVSYQASFVGYFPAEEPKYTCIVIVNAPSNDVYYGNLVAGPIFKEIAEKVYSGKLEMHKEMKYSKFVNDFSIKKGFANDISKISQNLNVKIYNNTIVNKPSVLKFKNKKLELEEIEYQKNKVPNVIGMCLKDALFLLENTGIKVTIKGKGTIYKQSLSPGTKVKKGNRIILELS